MPEARFPYEASKWETDIERKRRWYEALESIAPENVRAILALSKTGSRSTINAGTEDMAKGFAQEWLAWHDARKAKKEEAFRASQIYWTRWAALAASVAAVAGIFGWGISLLLRK
jgi:hypothetical protein